MPLSVEEDGRVDGPAIEPSDGDGGSMSAGAGIASGWAFDHRCELRHERLRSLGLDAALFTRLRMFEGLINLRTLLRNEDGLELDGFCATAPAPAPTSMGGSGWPVVIAGGGDESSEDVGSNA